MSSHEPESQPQTTYRVTGMSCAHCEAAVREEVEALADVTAATPSAQTGTLVVEGRASRDAIAAAVDEAGYALVD